MGNKWRIKQAESSTQLYSAGRGAWMEDRGGWTDGKQVED